MTLSHYANPSALINRAIARAIAPVKPLAVSEWADTHRKISSRDGELTGKWRTDRNPPLREPMDCFSARSQVREVVLVWPTQYGKTQVALNVVGYGIGHNPGATMVLLPAEASLKKWVLEKYRPMRDSSEAIRERMTSTVSRESANRMDFQEFEGGWLAFEHAGSPARLKSSSVRTLIIDELDELADNLRGDDPLDLARKRTSGYQATSKRLYISTPELKGLSRIEALYEDSDRRRYHVPCPHCGREQPLEWSGLQWDRTRTSVWYLCRACGAAIDEHHKTDMLRAGRWVAENPGHARRGYWLNALYSPLGLGDRWEVLVKEWIDAQNDAARLKTFINTRLAEGWEDPALRRVKFNVIAERAEGYSLRIAPEGVLAATAGVDTQDDRLEVQIVGWGRRLRAWTLDYVVLPGDPAGPEVWTALTELLNSPIEHASGGLLQVEAAAIDAGGHRTEDVYHYVRQRRIRRPMAIFGAKGNNAEVINRGKLIDFTFRGKPDKHSIRIFHVGTVGIKHHLYGRLSKDADLEPEQRMVRFSDQLRESYFTGLVSETYNPNKNRFEKKSGVRNEPLDTWVYAYAAAHHRELRLHRRTNADWDRAAQRLGEAYAPRNEKTGELRKAMEPKRARRRKTETPGGGFGSEEWNL